MPETISRPLCLLIILEEQQWQLRIRRLPNRRSERLRIKRKCSNFVSASALCAEMENLDQLVQKKYQADEFSHICLLAALGLQKDVKKYVLDYLSCHFQRAKIFYGSSQQFMSRFLLRDEAHVLLSASDLYAGAIAYDGQEDYACAYYGDGVELGASLSHQLRVASRACLHSLDGLIAETGILEHLSIPKGQSQRDFLERLICHPAEESQRQKLLNALYAAAEARDRLALKLLREEVESLLFYGRRLAALLPKQASARFILDGVVFQEYPLFKRLVCERLQLIFRGAEIIEGEADYSLEALDEFCEHVKVFDAKASDRRKRLIRYYPEIRRLKELKTVDPALASAKNHPGKRAPRR
ncbi:MAG: hypothetical protein Q4P72_00535 [Eubacteriales bacterium]|nr:hypothetical protein [Eubacteriales bacterium]